MTETISQSHRNTIKITAIKLRSLKILGEAGTVEPAWDPGGQMQITSGMWHVASRRWHVASGMYPYLLTCEHAYMQTCNLHNLQTWNMQT